MPVIVVQKKKNIESGLANLHLQGSIILRHFKLAHIDFGRLRNLWALKNSLVIQNIRFRRNKM